MGRFTRFIVGTTTVFWSGSLHNRACCGVPEGVYSRICGEILLGTPVAYPPAAVMSLDTSS